MFAKPKGDRHAAEIHLPQSPRKLSLSTALIVPFVLQIVAAVGLVGYLSYRNGQQAVNDLASQLQREIMTRVNERVQAYLEAPQIVNHLNQDATRLGILNFQDLKSAQPYLWQQIQNFQYIGYAGLANPQGQYLRVGWINRFNPDESPQLAQQLTLNGGDLVYSDLDRNGYSTQIAQITPNYDVRQRPFYTVAVEREQAAWSPIYPNIANRLLQMNASLPYYDNQGNLIGVFTAQIGLNQICNFLKTLTVSPSGFVLIMEPSGELVATSLKSQPLLKGEGKNQQRIKAQDSSNPIMRQSWFYLSNRLKKLDNLQKPMQLDFQVNNHRQFLSISPLRDNSGLNWLVVVVIPEDDFMAQINANSRYTIFLCLLAFGLAIVIGISTSRWLTRPIFKLTQASQQLADGHLDQRIKTNGYFELQEIITLENSFNRMAEQLQESFETLEEKVQERTDELAQANLEINDLNNQLQAENFHMSAELDVARHIQKMILPKPEELANIKGLDIAGYMEPADEVGGDYYDVLQADGVVTIGIGDVTGHGLESGLLMLMTQTAVRTLKEVQEQDPIKFLSTLNRTIYKNVKRMNSHRNLTLAILNYTDGRLGVSGQHEEMIIVRHHGKIERLDTLELGFPIGIEVNISDFISHTLIDLEPGDGIVVYTDGITEAWDQHRNQYGIDQLCNVISQNWDKSAEEIKEAVVTDVRQFIGQQKVFDDITLLVVKRWS